MFYNDINEVKEGIKMEILIRKETLIIGKAFLLRKITTMFLKTSLSQKEFSGINDIIIKLKKLDTMLNVNTNLDELDKSIDKLSKELSGLTNCIDRQELDAVCGVEFVKSNERIFEVSKYKRSDYFGSDFEYQRRNICLLTNTPIQSVIDFARESGIPQWKGFEYLERYETLETVFIRL